MWKIPRKVSLVAGHGEGGTALAAFDSALRDAGIALANLVRVTSVFPPGARLVPLPKIAEGILLPVTYEHIVSHRAGEIITAVIGIGIPEDEKEGGVIVEHKGVGTTAELEQVIRGMLQELFAARKRRLKEVKMISVEHQVEKLGCAVAAAVFLE